MRYVNVFSSDDSSFARYLSPPPPASSSSSFIIIQIIYFFFLHFFATILVALCLEFLFGNFTFSSAAERFGLVAGVELLNESIIYYLNVFWPLICIFTQQVHPLAQLDLTD